MGESGSRNLERLVQKLNIAKECKCVTDLYSQPTYRNPSHEPDPSCVSAHPSALSPSPQSLVGGNAAVTGGAGPEREVVTRWFFEPLPQVSHRVHVYAFVT